MYSKMDQLNFILFKSPCQDIPRFREVLGSAVPWDNRLTTSSDLEYTTNRSGGKNLSSFGHQMLCKSLARLQNCLNELSMQMSVTVPELGYDRLILSRSLAFSTHWPIPRLNSTLTSRSTCAIAFLLEQFE